MSNYVEKIKIYMKEHRFGKDSFLILILGGVLLLVIAWPVSTEKKKSNGVQSDITDSSYDILEEGTGSQGDETDQYAAALEKRLEELLEKMEGVGAVDVMVTIKKSGEEVALKDVTQSSSETREQNGTGEEAQLLSTDQQQSETTVYIKDADGNQYPCIISAVQPEILGIAVVAQGGENAGVQRTITEVIQSLFRLEANRIIVTKMKS